jgi:hypothetical protein
LYHPLIFFACFPNPTLPALLNPDRLRLYGSLCLFEQPQAEGNDLVSLFAGFRVCFGP